MIVNQNGIELIQYMIDWGIGVEYNVTTKAFYKRAYNKKVGEILSDFLFYCPITLIGVIKYNNNYFIQFTITDEEFKLSIKEIITKFKTDYNLLSNDIKFLTLFLTKYIEEAIEKQTYQELFDIIYLDHENTFQTHFSEEINLIDVKKQLEILNEFKDKTTDNKYFIISFIYHTLELMAYFIRSHRKEFPFLIPWGYSRAGKTALQLLFLERGQDQDAKDKELTPIYTYNEIRSIYMSARCLQKNLKGKIFDDVHPEYFQKFSAELKGAASSNMFARRGRQNQTESDYGYLSNVSFSVNQQIDLEKANSFRSLLLQYTSKHKKKQNIKQWYELVNKLDRGFILKIFQECFTNISIHEIINILESITVSEEYNQKLISFGYEKLQQLYKTYSLELAFEEPLLDKNDDNNFEDLFIEFLLNEWNHIKEAEQSINSTIEDNIIDSAGNPHTITKTTKSKYFYRPLLSKQHIEVNEREHIIYITNSGIKIFIDKFKHPYWRSMIDYVFDSKLLIPPEIKSYRLHGGRNQKCIIIHYEEFKEDLTNEDKIILLIKNFSLLEEILKKAEKQDISKIIVTEIITNLLTEGKIYEPRPGEFKLSE